MLADAKPDNISIEDQLEWEDYKGDIPFWKHAIAGSCAGVAEHVLMFPLDTAKTRLQAWSSGPAEDRTFTQAFRTAYGERGFVGLFRGAGAITSGCIPAHAALFGVYEFMKEAVDLEDEGHHPIKAGICGASATLCHDAILTPLDVVKQRLQLGCYKNSMDCLQSILKTEGPVALFRSMPTTVLMNLPFGSIMVAVNESMKELCGIRTVDNKPSPPPSSASTSVNGSSPAAAASTGLSSFPVSSKVVACDTSLSTPCCSETKKASSTPHIFSALPLYFLCAGVAGGVAAAATTPFDVIKTRLQTQDCTLIKECCTPGNPNCNAPSSSPSAAAATTTATSISERVNVRHGPKYSGFASTLKIIMKEEGIRGLYRGSLARVGLQAPATAICWGTYESIKWLLGAKAFGKEPI